MKISILNTSIFLTVLLCLEFFIVSGEQNHHSVKKKSRRNFEKKQREPRKIRISKSDNDVSRLAENVIVYAGGEELFLESNINAGDNIIDAIVNVYDLLSERMDSLQNRVSAVEHKTKEISDRLNHMDCYDVKIENPLAMDGIFSFHLDYKGKRPIKVYCDMITEGGGWTVIQQRLPREENDTSFYTGFLRNFHDYQVGFGSADNDYWLGLENLYSLTNSRQYELRIELGDFANKKAHAHYKRFYVEGESQGYRLHVNGYSGNAGDSLSTDKEYDNFTADGMLFSTYDEDHDTSAEINCSSFWNIGGWWFNRCSWANLNGPYNFQEEGEDCIGVNWHKWRNKQCLKSTKMMIRPVRHS
ncbi:UNVERIFIED_CONTAM: hypothetical protein RMT77_001630 [Armadillidium vulgare]